MFKNYLIGILFCFWVASLRAQLPKSPDSLLTPFEHGRGLQTATHADGIAFYEKLSRLFPKHLRLETRGVTDCGLPLHLLVVSDDAMKASPQYATKKK
jgi:hypothetical protein